MRRGALAPLLRRKGWFGLLLLGLVTLLLGSALLVPHLNPFTRGPLLGAQGVSAIWGEVNYWRVVIDEYTLYTGRWPEDLQQLPSPPAASRLLDVASPQVNRLVFTIHDLPELGDLAGTQFILDFKPGSQAMVCRPGSPPTPRRYLPINCLDPAEGSVEAPAITGLRYLILFCGAVLLLAALVLALRHPTLGPAHLKPQALRRTPPQNLAAVDRLLGLLGRRTAALAAAGISTADWAAALAFARQQGAARADGLAQAIGVRTQLKSEWSLPGAVQEWQFADQLPLTLDRCLVYIPDPALDEEGVVRQLRTTPTGLDVMLVIASADCAANGPLLQHCADHANLLVGVDPAAQGEWLLSGNAAAVLLRLLAAQLRVTRISPYQTRGGVVRSSAFFGRAQLLARVLNREPANYLVVGGRQLGKSSLLKAIQRRLQGHPQVACHYVSLRDHRLAPRLALQFGLAATTPLEAVIDHLATHHAGKRLFLLIDEADLFFRDEARHDYAQLSALRALSDEGRCWFMLAGFWDLYSAAVLDYQSPLRNFGEVLTIGGLEKPACRELATVPLAHLRLSFADDGLVTRIVDLSGQRANLVAIICQECLEALEPGERVIGSRHLDQALISQPVLDALAGWGRLCHDEVACQLDRIAVYHAVLQGGHTSLNALATLFTQHGQSAPADALKQALARLQLAYIFLRSGGDYQFAIPLFQRQFEEEEVQLLLAQELAKPRAGDGAHRP